MNKILIAAFTMTFFSPMALAIETDTPESSCKEAVALIKDEAYKEALEEARWCVTALENLLQASTSELFSDSVAGWKRVDVKQNNTMGMGAITANYKKGNGSLTVTLLGDQGSGGILGGALSGLAKMGIMGAAGSKRFRVQRLKATVDAQGSIMVSLDDGSIIQIQSPQYKNADAALEGLSDFMDEFPFKEINDQRR